MPPRRSAPTNRNYILKVAEQQIDRPSLWRPSHDLNMPITVDDLGPQQRRILDAVVAHGAAETCSIVEALGLSRASVGTVLLRLQRLGLLVRERAHDGRGRLYPWRMKDPIK